jgi:flagellar hook-length control protein FliK
MTSASPTLISPEPKLVDRAAPPRSLDRSRTTDEPSFREVLQATEGRGETTEAPREATQTDSTADERTAEPDSPASAVDEQPTEETDGQTAESGRSHDSRSDAPSDAEVPQDDAQQSPDGQDVPVETVEAAQHQPNAAQALPFQSQSTDVPPAADTKSSGESTGKATTAPTIHQTVQADVDGRVVQRVIEPPATKDASTPTVDASRRMPARQPASQPVVDSQRAVVPTPNRPAEAPASSTQGERPTGAAGTPATTERAVETLRQQTQADSGQQQANQDASAEKRRPTIPNIQSNTSATPAAGRAIEVDDAIRLENLARSSAGGETNIRIQPMTTGTSAAQVSMKVDVVEQIVSSSASTSSSDEQALTNRIVRGLSTMVHQRGGTMSMRLSPPELGALRVQMSIVQGNVTAQFTATTQQAQALLEQNMGVLRTALEQHGLTVDRLAVHLSPSESNNAARQEMNGQQQQGQTAHQHNAGGGESRGRFDGERGGSFDHRDGPREFQLDLESFAASFAAESDTTSIGADVS